MGALDEQRWLDVRRFRALHEAGASVSEIARETGLNWRTVKKYLAADMVEVTPPQRARPARPQVIDAFAHVVDAWLRAELLLKGTVIHERLVEQYGFGGNYQRVKLYLQQARPRIAAELGISPDQLAGLHRRFEVVPGAQAQVDWGDEGAILAHVGIAKVYSFHMVLSYSRDPFCCFTTSQDLAAFWGAHRRAFAHFGGVPGAIVYDRTKTVVRRHVAPGMAVPLHPEAVAFAGHYDFDVDVLAAYRPTGKGRVERQVTIVRDHVLAGRAFSSLSELDAAFAAWVPQRRARRHRTHGEIIGVRAVRDHAAMRPIPTRPYVVADRHLRHVGKDCLVAYAGNLYSVPARRADTASLGYLDFLDLVLQEELAVRDERRFRAGLRLSKLPHHKTLDDYDFSFQPDLDPRKVRDLATLAFVQAKANVALLGPPGVGKTHIAVALAIDEVGYQPLERTEANLVFQVISKRYEKGSTLLTSNKGFGEWGQVFGDEVLATAILDRLLHHCDVVPINGPSYRLKNRLTAIDNVA